MTVTLYHGLILSALLALPLCFSTSLYYVFPFFFFSPSLSLSIHSPFNSKTIFSHLIHALIHTDFTVNAWHRFEPLPRSQVLICLGGALVVTSNPGGVTDTVLTANLTFGNLIFILFSFH